MITILALCVFKNILKISTSGKGVLDTKGVFAYLRQECHNSKFGIFELLVRKETFTDALLTGIVL
jgi:hypothetical protein